MTIEDRIKAFSLLGKRLQSDEEDKIALAQKAGLENPWFTQDNVLMAIHGIVKLLDHQSLKQWLSAYFLPEKKSNTIAVVMAGNIPLVGFHDFLCVLISGNSMQTKLSSKDSVLLTHIANRLIEIEPRFQQYISFVERIKNFDAVIATGSNNSARYFEYYFGKYPHIIRKNRASCAILNGKETDAELQELGTDVFSYFGLGCRNVSKLFVPLGYDFGKLFLAWEKFRPIIHHHKYGNNYDYQKSIVLVNKIPFLDNGFVLLTESDALVSPISTVYYEYFSSKEELKDKIDSIKDKLQCTVGSWSSTTPVGQAQYPAVGDYADQVDTMKFLSELD